MGNQEPDKEGRFAEQNFENQSDILLEQAEIDAAVEDMSRFSVLYDRYYSRIFRFVFQRLGDEDISADVTSKVFLNAMVHLKSYRHQGYPFASWLYRIARNEVNQHYRREKAERTYQAQWKDITDMVHDAQGRDDEVMMQQLARALRKLNAPDMEMVVMRYFEKRSFREIGDILSMTENNAKVRMFRIIQRLKRIMKV